MFDVDVRPDLNSLGPQMSSVPQQIVGNTLKQPLVRHTGSAENIHPDERSSACHGNSHRTSSIISKDIDSKRNLKTPSQFGRK